MDSAADEDFHGLFPLRKKYTNWYLDTKSDEDINREEDIQILRDWRLLAGAAPREVH